MARGDDESQWDSDPLVRALRAPGTPQELAGQSEFVAAYRAQQPRGSVRRLVGRFGIGATTAVTTIALSAGVAAAYGRVLPDPVQRIAHSVLGPVGVPAPTTGKQKLPVVAPTGSVTAPRTSATPGARATPSGKPLPTSATTSAGSVRTTQPSQTPAPTDLPTPTSSPTTTATPGVHRTPSSVSAAASDRKVLAGSTVTVTGLVAAQDGTALRGRLVRLMGRAGGKWTELATGRTNRTGYVALETPTLEENTGLRLSVGHGVRSALVGVVVLPVLRAGVAEAAGTTTVTITTRGGREGDVVTAYRRKGDSWVAVGSAQLDADGTATLAVPTPRRSVRLVLRLPASKHHGKAQTSVRIGSPAAG
jgi:hypothetical protein